MAKYKYSRQELYEILWKKPTTHLAKELGIKAHHIRKICKHYLIPLPNSGYWSKLQFGKETKIESMESHKKYDSIEINLKDPFINGKDQYGTKLSKRIKKIESKFPKESRPKKKRTNTDPMVVMAGNYLKSSQAKESFHDGKVRPKEGIISIEVSKSLISRALKFTNSFILLCKLRGHEIIIRGSETILKVEGEEYKIRIREKSNRVANTSDWFRTTDLVPNGKLSLKIDDYNSKEWCDTKTKSLEDQLSKIVAAFELRAQKDIADREEWKLIRIEQERLRKIEENKQAKILWEKKKIKMLQNHSIKWNESRNLSLFINELEKQKNLSKEQEDWINWAKNVVEYLNPLSNGIDELIDQYDFNHDRK